MTATLTQHDSDGRSTSLFARDILAVDAGNRTTQWVNPDGEVITIPSILKHFEDWEDLPECTDESPVIELQDEEFAVTDRYVIGVEAKIQKGKPAFAYDKIKMAKYLVFAALEPHLTQEVIVVNKLRLALPDSRNSDNATVLQGLAGMFNFTRNGRRLVASIRQVELVDETKAAYKYAIRHRVFQRPSSKINGVLDLGGGTVIGRLYSPSGQALRQYDVIGKGTFELANKVNAAMLRSQNESLDHTQIMDAIADGTLCTDSGVNFSGVFEKCRNSWLEDIRAQVRVMWASQFRELGEVIIVGGSAPLAKQIQADTTGRFFVAHNHATISIEGMVL